MPADSMDTYEAIGNREDLTDIIYDISPTDCPFMSGVGRSTATSTLHEWQIDSLGAAVATNQAIEGADATIAAVTATARRNNRTEIATAAFGISGTQEAVNKAGRKSELSYQTAKHAREMKRDMEASCLANKPAVAGDATTARDLAGIGAWITTNDVFASDGGSPTVATGADARTDGTQEAFTEANLKTSLQNTWTSGGEPDCIMVGAFNKQVLSGFSGNSTRFNSSEDQKLITSVDVYVSDFGSLEVVPNRFQRARDCLILQKDMWAIAYLRPFEVIDIARKGDSVEKQLVVEFTLEAKNEAANGGVFDLTTS